jgi:hypothetical protein
MHDYENAGEALGRLLLKCKHPLVTLGCLTVMPVVVFIGIKFLFV